MSILTKNKFFYRNLFYLIIILLFSFFINFYYANIGVFPIDSFLHYDSANRIINNEYPVKDFWVVSGISVDFLQAFFFKILGTNWFSYIIHSSLMNCLIGVLAYNFFRDLKISETKSLIYTICFATLAYTISGTPFVDLHASFFLLINTFLIIKFISNPKKKYLLHLAVLTFFLSFFSKQVPSAYALILYGPILIFYLIKNKNFEPFKIIFFSATTLSLIFYLILLGLQIDFKLFIDEYINYPRLIGSNRLNLLDLSFISFFNKFKFIILPIFLICILKLRSFYFKKNFIFDEFIKFLIIISYSICLVVHQLLTKNQIFIYFLIPILFALIEIELSFIKKKHVNLITTTLLIILLIVTFKYHFRFNENRKFHELAKTDLNISEDAEILDRSLAGLKWINPFFDGDPLEEITILKKGINELNKKENEIILFTNYLFIDSLTIKKMHYPSRAITSDGTTLPLKENKYFDKYQTFLKNIIFTKKINEVYFFKHENLPLNLFTNYLSSECYNSKNDSESVFFKFEIKCLK